MESISVSRQRTEVLVNDFVRSVYNWMCIGLALTGMMAFYVSTSDEMMHLVFDNGFIFFGLIIAELALVFSIGIRTAVMVVISIDKMMLLSDASN